MKKNLFLFLIAICLIAFSFLLDEPIYSFLFAFQPICLIKTAKFFSKYGDWIWLMIGCGFFLVLAIRSQNDTWRRLLITMMILSSLTGLSADLIRAVTGRARPNSGMTPGWYGIRHDSRWLIIDSRYNAFPSGHTAAAFGLVTPLLLLRRRSAWPLLLLAVLIALSRLILRAHHFSDVFTSILLAFGITRWWLISGAMLIPPRFRPLNSSHNQSVDVSSH